MAQRLIGSGTTDSNGRISVSYEGKGAGKLQLVAKNGNLLSEIYELIDAEFYDTGVSDTANTDWIGNSNGSATAGTTGTTLTCTSSGGFYRFANKPGTSNNAFDWTGKYVIEFDIVGIDGNKCGIQLYDGTSTVNMYPTTYGAEAGNHVKVIVTSDNTRGLYINDTKVVGMNVDLTNSNSRVGLMVTDTTQTFTYRNFMIYPI